MIFHLAQVLLLLYLHLATMTAKLPMLVVAAKREQSITQVASIVWTPGLLTITMRLRQKLMASYSKT
jgi:hypothetical protein